METESIKFSGFTFIVTEECNFDCSYCYQKKGNTAMDMALLKKAFDYFSPFFNDDPHISYYGNEPLLAFDLIKESVDYILGKKLKKEFQLALTTNGSLLNTEMLELFNRHKFSLLLSFDGLAQEILRKKGTFETVLANVKKTLTYPDIDVATNSVFTPESLHLLSESLEFIVNLGIKEIQISISTISKWDRDAILLLEKELEKTRNFLIPIYKKTGAIPVDIFIKKTQKGLFGCNAGASRMTTAADGKLWGYYLFSDYFKGKEETKNYHKYCFG
ncbi:radical SAM protein, partial [Acidobacteriota bacterium]